MAKVTEQGEPRYTLENLEQAFRDGVAVGIASQDGTFGGENFMGEAELKADKFIKETNDEMYAYSDADWENVWAYSGGGNVLEYPTETEAEKPATADWVNEPRPPKVN